MRLNKYIKERYLEFIVWAIIFFVIWIQIIPQSQSVLESTLFSLCFLGTSFPFIKYLSENLLQKAIRAKTIRKFILQFILVSVLTGSFFVFFYFVFAYLEKEAVFPTSAYFDTDVPLVLLLIPMSSGIFLGLCICGLRFFQENTKLKKTLIEYQLRTLQHQVTPHFMFNVLNHIHILMQTDVRLASDLLIKYSEILRYQLYNGEKQNVTLEQDVQFLKDFISVEEVRWEGKLTVTCSWKLEDPDKEIPSLLFITFIENAFKHVSKSDFERGYINIDFEQKENSVFLNVENSKSTLSKKKKDAGGLGLKNIKQRLDILYFEKYDLSVEETETTYQTKLIIHI